MKTTRSSEISLDSSLCCLLRIPVQRRSELERHLYVRYPEREWGTFFQFGFRQTHWGLALSFIGGLWPQAGDLRRDSPIVTIDTTYSLRAVDAVGGCPFGIGMIHSHPEGCATFPSSLDDDMDGYYSQLFEDYGPGRPYCSLIFSRSAEGRFRFTGRVHLDGNWYPVTEILTTGDDVLVREHAEEDQVTAELISNEAQPKESVTARLKTLLGSASIDRLRDATIAVIGCSGTGSPAIEALARAGVGSFVLVDPKRLAFSNLERLHGSTFADTCGGELPYKVEVVARMIREINPAAQVTSIVGNILDEFVLDELLCADVVLGCTDSQHSRAALGDLAAHYLLPSLDVGVVFEGADGVVGAQLAQFTKFGPEQPCGFCGGMIDSNALAVELMTEEEKQSRRMAADRANTAGVDGAQYWRGDAPPLITVGYLTSTAGSLAAGYVIGWLTGKFRMPHSQFQFDISALEFGFVIVDRKRIETCSCGRTIGFADQARADRSVSMPAHWPAALLITDESIKDKSSVGARTRLSWRQQLLRWLGRMLGTRDS